MYRLMFNVFTNTIISVENNGAQIPFDPANTDYQIFKAQILNDEATLQDADGVEMTPQAAKEFIRTLP